MYSLIVSLALFGQVPVPEIPPEIPPSPKAKNIDEMKTWLVTRLATDGAMDAQKTAEVSRLVDSMNEQQLGILTTFYKERLARKDNALKSQLDANQQLLLDQAKLNQQQAEAYRDSLKREYERQILQGQMNQNLLYQNMVNNQRAMYMMNGPLTYSYGPVGMSPWGYNGLGYSVLGYGGANFSAANYGVYGMGVPAFGQPIYYGSP